MLPFLSLYIEGIEQRLDKFSEVPPIDLDTGAAIEAACGHRGAPPTALRMSLLAPLGCDPNPRRGGSSPSTTSSSGRP